MEHTAVVSILAMYIGSQVGADTATLLERALLHDMEETITGDIPTPTKYHNPRITAEIQKFEQIAAEEVAQKYFGDWALKAWANAKDGTLEGEILKIADAGAVVYKIKQEKALGNSSFDQYGENVWNALLHIKNGLTNDCLIPYVHELMDLTLTGETNEHP